VVFENVTMQSLPPTPTGLLPDTGQVGSYTTSFGEDSDYTTNPPAYTVNGNGTTTDNITGLMWQSSDDNIKYFVNQAADVCSNMTLAGYGDWRLPTVHELQGIVNYGAFPRAIDQSAFPGTEMNYYWSSTQSAIYPSDNYMVSFNKGVVAHGNVYPYYVRCVRGGQTVHGFTDNGDYTVTEINTSLVWQQEDDNVVRTWEQALAYCEELEFAGQTDWRLPNIKELGSIADMEQDMYPLINQNRFYGAEPDGYWSSTTSADNGSYAWQLSLHNGWVFDIHKDFGYYVRCVRGGQ